MSEQTIPVTLDTANWQSVFTGATEQGCTADEYIALLVQADDNERRLLPNAVESMLARLENKINGITFAIQGVDKRLADQQNDKSIKIELDDGEIEMLQVIAQRRHISVREAASNIVRVALVKAQQEAGE